MTQVTFFSEKHAYKARRWKSVSTLSCTINILIPFLSNILVTSANRGWNLLLKVENCWIGDGSNVFTIYHLVFLCVSLVFFTAKFLEEPQVFPYLHAVLKPHGVVFSLYGNSSSFMASQILHVGRLCSSLTCQQQNFTHSHSQTPFSGYLLRSLADPSLLDNSIHSNGSDVTWW